MKSLLREYNFRNPFVKYLHAVNIYLTSRNFAYLDKTAQISSKARIVGANEISIGAYTIVHPFATIQSSMWNSEIPSAGKITIGEYCAIQSYAHLWTNGGDIQIGHHCSINPFCSIYGHGGLTIGNYVRIAPHSVIIPGNHNFDRIDIPIALQGSTLLGVVIKDDVWIGANVCILDGVEIAEGCVIGAGSVVTKSTDPYGIYAGAPAKKIKDRGL